MFAPSPNPALDPQHAPRLLWSCFSLAFVTGLLGGLAKKLHPRDALIAAAVSGGAGLVVGCLGMVAWPDKPYLTWAACGLAGWAGGNVVLDRLTLVAWTILKGYAPPEAAPLFEAAEKLSASRTAPPHPSRAGTPVPQLPQATGGWPDLDLPPLPVR